MSARPGAAQRVLVALGGNAMTGADGSATTVAQQEALAMACRRLGELIRAGHELVITHGNGPQVGNLLVKNELAAQEVPPVPLDWCVAQTQATIGFTIQNALLGALGADVPRTVVQVTRTVVAADDPGFARPTKPVGRYVPEERARALMAHGQIWADRGERGWRRMVASPEPIEVLDTDTMRELIDGGHVLVAAGGGGIPVLRESDGTIRGVEAVIDKDLTAALLGPALECTVLIIATDVDHVLLDYDTPKQRPLEHVAPERLRELAAAGMFASGSMGPKVEAALRFVGTGDRRCVITSLDHIAEAVDGGFGTIISNDPPVPSAPH